MTDSEAKAHFFAQYYFQQVLCTKSEKFNPVYLTAQSLEFRVLNDFPTDYLLLRSVNQLTDDEALQCAKVEFSFFDISGFEIKVVRERNAIYVCAIDGKSCLVKIEISNPWKLNIGAVDYLRSIGILLPFTYLSEGKPITLTPAEIIEKGWAKIK